MFALAGRQTVRTHTQSCVLNAPPARSANDTARAAMLMTRTDRLCLPRARAPNHSVNATRSSRPKLMICVFGARVRAFALLICVHSAADADADGRLPCVADSMAKKLAIYAIVALLCVGAA